MVNPIQIIRRYCKDETAIIKAIEERCLPGEDGTPAKYEFIGPIKKETNVWPIHFENLSSKRKRNRKKLLEHTELWSAAIRMIEPGKSEGEKND